MNLKRRLRGIISGNPMLIRGKRVSKKVYRKTWYFSPLPREARYAIVIAQERTGSTLFMDLLACHPSILADQHNFYDPSTWPDRYRSGRTVFSRKPVRCYKFKVAEAPHRSSEEAARTFLREIGEKVHVIRLQRANKFRQALSAYISQTKGVLHHRDGEKGKAVQTRHVDPEKVIDIMDYYIRLTAFEEEALEGVPHRSLVYEEDLVNEQWHQRTMDRVFEYMEIPARPVQARTSRTSKPHISEYIQNYEEVVEALKERDYAHFLENTP